MSKFCCIDSRDIMFNQNYPNSQRGLTDTKKESFRQQKSHSELVPMSQINMPIANMESSSSFSITSEYVIMKREGSPIPDYDIISKIGEGAYGKVFKVRNKRNNKLRALKQINVFNMNENKRKKIMREIEILKNLDHIYINKLYEYYINENYIYLINELSTEGDLQRKFWKIKIFPEFVVKIIMLQIFSALIYLNEKSIIHGDLKLENILVMNYRNENIKKDKKNKTNVKDADGFIEAIKHDMKIINRKSNDLQKSDTHKNLDIKSINDIHKNVKENQPEQNANFHTTNFKIKKRNFHENDVEKELNLKNKNIINNRKIKKEKLYIYNYGIKLIDFGCSKIFTRVKKNFSDTIGTLVYCSPEVLLGNYNKSCDIWSCGVIMYYLLSGHFPFEGVTEEQITNKIMEAKFEFDVKHFKNISEEAKDLISKCLKYHPNERISIHQVLNHKFFNDIKGELSFTEEEIMQLKNLKAINQKSKFYQLVLTYLSYNFSDNKLLNELNALYNKLDKNTDFKITKSELYKAYKKANISITPNEIDDIVNSMDFNINGNIDYEEFIRMCIPKEKLFTEENLKNAFSMFDTEGKGFITPQKIIDFIESTKHINEDLKSQIKNEITDMADEIIDFEGFMHLMINLSNNDN